MRIKIKYRGPKKKKKKKEVETELLMRCRHFVYNLELNSRKTESECCEKKILEAATWEEEEIFLKSGNQFENK